MVESGAPQPVPTPEERLIPTPCPENHASITTWLPDGSLGCAWFGGSREGRPDISIYFSRWDAGTREWSDAVQVSQDPGRSEQNPVLTVHPNGSLTVWYTSQEFGAQDTSLVMRQDSTDDGRTWGPASQVFPDPGLFLRQPVLQLTPTRWLLPVFRCHPLPGRKWHGHADTSAVAVSEDAGSSWRVVEVPGSTGAVHLSLVALGGDEVVGFYRSRWADVVHRSVSHDAGETWSAPAPLDVPNNNSSIQVAADPQRGAGHLLMVANPVAAAPGAAAGDLVEEDDPHKLKTDGERVPLDRHAVWGTARLPLTLLRSADAGLHWERVLDLESTELDPAQWNGPAGRANEMSYPTVTPAPDGSAHVTYSYRRTAIKHVVVPGALIER